MKKILPSILLVVLLCIPYVNVQAGLLSENTRASKKSTSVSKSEGEWLITYYVGYQSNYLKPRNVDYSLMTHIVVGGVGVTSDGTLREHWHLEGKDTKKKGRDMAKDIGKRADKEGVKKLVWLGGPNEEDLFLSASSDAYRAKFVKNILTLLEEINYDGVDIDWEPVRKQDEPYLLKLVQDLRKADPDIIITIPVNWVQSTIASSKDLSVYKDMAKYVDKMFVMSYSMAGPWSGWKSWHGGALTGDGSTTPGSIGSSISAYTSQGVPKEKIGIGIGTYATCWEYPVTKPNQVLPSGYTSSKLHVMSMRTMMDDYYKRSSEKWDGKAKVPYLSFKKKQGDFKCGFISYENDRSVEEKANYVNEEGLGGILVWNIGTGYFPKNSSKNRHPLLEKAWEILRKE